MLDRKMLDRLSPTQVLINTSRGAVFDGQELKNALRQKRISGAIMDVWDEEPIVDYSLLELADIGTPHIAGGALDGKIRATEMIRKDWADFSESDPSGSRIQFIRRPSPFVPKPEQADRRPYNRFFCRHSIS